MDQRTQFIADHLRDALSITELCELYGISRKTGYKWIDRYVRHGPAGLEERSRRPQRSPRQTSDEIVNAILDARRRHPRWGGKKLLALLHKRHPRWDLPGRSTGVRHLEPTWDGADQTSAPAPRASSPASRRRTAGMNALHRTLKDETTRPAAGSLTAQQRRFNIFREEFNHERPHEALDQETPATCYAPSPRPMPDRVPPLEYPDRFEVRYVSANGGIRWNSRWVNVSTVCIGEYVGLEEIADGIWNVYFGPLRLGRLSERHMRIEDEYGRLYRRHV